MPMTEAKKQANKRWNDANMGTRYDRIQLVVPKGRKQTIADEAVKHGLSLNAFVNSLLCAACGLDESEWKNDI